MSADTDNFIVRPWHEGDVKQALDLMKQLSVFEGYDEDFAVTQDDLLHYGFSETPRFTVFVAEQSLSGRLVGIAVCYEIPWTFDMRPTLVLKEMFVDQNVRGLKIGSSLFERVKERASEIGASRLNWTVLKNNWRAEQFYRNHGGRRDEKWRPWTFAVE